MATKRKATTAIVAGVTAAALLLGGTFAWTSINQQAKNEAIVDINPGGRLHDDFNGTNKDIYVENFGDTATGVPIFARIRLDQYFEVGQDAGINKEGAARKVTKVLGDETDINDVTSWVTYIPGDLTDTESVQANGNWSWKLGKAEDEGLPYYMPTFNKNKDSLAADSNGSYEGKTKGDIVYYDDYVQYGSAEQQAANDQIVVNKTDTEVYDWDDNDADEEENPNITTVDTTPRDDADVYHKENQEHTATQLSTGATVMTMKAWTDAGSVPGPYWVYDTDGWAYWAQAIEPTMTTGLLLDSIKMTKVPDDNYYYSINVVAQFATAGDIQAFNSGLTEDETWTAAAEDLFAKITNTETVAITAADGSETVYPGGNITFSAARMVAGAAAANQPTFTWSATDAEGAAIDGVSIDQTGKLSVASTVPGGTAITVTATAGDGTATADSETKPLSYSKVIYVEAPIKYEYTYTPLSGDPVTASGNVTMNPDSGSLYIPELAVQNEVGETVVIKLDSAIDFDKTINAEWNVKKSTKIEKIDDYTVKFSFTGDAWPYGAYGVNGVYNTVILNIYMQDGREVDAHYEEPIRTEETLKLLYIRDGAEAQEVTEDTVLQLGDIIYASVASDDITSLDENHFFEGESTRAVSGVTFTETAAASGKNSRQYRIDSALTAEKTVTIKVYTEAIYGDDEWSRFVIHNNTYTVKITPTSAE